jgi:hypothetical protein
MISLIQKRTEVICSQSMPIAASSTFAGARTGTMKNSVYVATAAQDGTQTECLKQTALSRQKAEDVAHQRMLKRYHKEAQASKIPLPDPEEIQQRAREQRIIGTATILERPFCDVEEFRALPDKNGNHRYLVILETPLSPTRATINEAADEIARKESRNGRKKAYPLAGVPRKQKSRKPQRDTVGVHA